MPDLDSNECYDEDDAVRVDLRELDVDAMSPIRRILGDARQAVW